MNVFILFSGMALKHANGSIRWIYEKGQGIFTPAGELDYLTGVLFDITERRRSHELMIQTEKMMSVGGLAAGIAFEKATVLIAIELKHIPIIAVTASAMKTDEELISSLCDSYIKKPFTGQDLIAEIIKYLPHSAKREDSGEPTPKEFIHETLSAHPDLRKPNRHHTHAFFTPFEFIPNNHKTYLSNFSKVWPPAGVSSSPPKGPSEANYSRPLRRP